MKDLFDAIGARTCSFAESYSELLQKKNEVLASDVVFLDVNLGPNLPSGVDAYRWLLGQKFGGTVVFFTGHARSHPLVQEAQHFPNVKILEKPAHIAEIEALIK